MSFLTITPKQGTGNKKITVSAAENYDAQMRTEKILVTNGVVTREVSVSQHFEPYMTVIQSTFQYTGGTTQITCYSSYEFYLGWAADWITLRETITGKVYTKGTKIPASPSGKRFIVEVASNTGAQRSADIYLNFDYVRGDSGSADITITQSKIPDATISIAPVLTAVDEYSGTTTFTIKSNTGWTVSLPQDSFIYYVSGATAGTGNGEITIGYMQNYGDARTEFILAQTNRGGVTATARIQQSAHIEDPVLWAEISPTTLEDTSGTTSLNIVSNTGWTISLPSWCSTSASLSGSGNKTITINVAENTSEDERTGNIVVSSSAGSIVRTLYLKQNGKPSGNTFTITGITVYNELSREYERTEFISSLYSSLFQSQRYDSANLFVNGTSRDMIPSFSTLGPFECGRDIVIKDFEFGVNAWVSGYGEETPVGDGMLEVFTESAKSDNIYLDQEGYYKGDLIIRADATGPQKLMIYVYD